MKKIIPALLILAFIMPVLSYAMPPIPRQDQVVKPTDGIKAMFENQQYREIIDDYAGKPRTLSAEELTYVALSYLRVEDVPNATKYADLAVQKDAGYANAYYAKGITSSMLGKYADATKNLQKALELSPKSAEYYTELGDIYYAQDDYVKALSNYRQAIKLPVPSEKAYFMIGAVYAIQDNDKAALDTFYVAKEKIKKDKELLVNVLYNIGKIQYDSNEFKKAADAYQELVEYFPDDFYSLEKMVECYNTLGYYGRANVPKTKLYAAYEKGQLATTSLFDKFCIDRFSMGTKDVSGYERFEKPTCRPMVKNIFYVADTDGVMDYIILLEYEPATEEGAKGSFKPIKLKDNQRYIYPVVFDEDVDYSTLQPYIKDIVAEKVEGTLATK